MGQVTSEAVTKLVERLRSRATEAGAVYYSDFLGNELLDREAAEVIAALQARLTRLDMGLIERALLGARFALYENEGDDADFSELDAAIKAIRESQHVT